MKNHNQIFEFKKILNKVTKKFPRKDKEYQVAKDFHDSKLGGKALLFTNDVGLILLREIKDDWDCVSDVIGSVRDCRECLPKGSGSLIKLNGIQLVIESKEDITNDTVQALENFGFMFQHTTVPCTENGIYCSVFFQQQSDNWSKDFEDFLKTYPDYLRKKYEEINRND